jgi:hypothetical protein
MTTLKALGAVVVLSALAVPVAAQAPACSIPQSPRNISKGSPSPYNGTYRTSIVELTKDPDVLVYKPRAGVTSHTLYRCGQHYHFPIETPQGCSGEIPPKGQAGAKPKPGQWVEVHTVYAANKEHPDICDPETLNCCTKPPFLVRAFSAKVTAGGLPGPIPPPTGRPLAEWSGSTTGADSVPPACKPAAEWSFRLSCDFTVSEGQLSLFRLVDPARPVQPANRLSRDLTQVLP